MGNILKGGDDMKRLLVFVLLMAVFLTANLAQSVTGTYTRLNQFMPEDTKYRVAVTFDASYPTGGESLNVKGYLNKINYAFVESHGKGGYFIDIDPTGFSSGYMKVMIFELHRDSTATDTTQAQEFPDTTDATGVTGVRLIISGNKY
jgi:hypothetical protein